MTRQTVWRSAGTLYALAAGVGIIAGIGAIGFQYLSSAVFWLVLEEWVGYRPGGPRGEPHLFTPGAGAELLVAGLLVAPTLGGLVSGWLCHRFAPEASGHGTDAVIDAYHHGKGRISPAVPFVKAFATAISLGTGGSGGREGPIAQIGAAFGSYLGGLFHLSTKQRRILMAVGMGAGVGAIFRAPLAGALFAAEILYREAEFESEVLMPSFIGSAISYCVFCGWFGEFGSVFELQTAAYTFHGALELLPYSLLALALVPCVGLYVSVFYGAEHLFAKIRLPRPLVTALGGLSCGATGVIAWQLIGDQRVLACLSYGYGILQESLDQAPELLGWNGVKILLAVALLKILTTAMTISSGGSGGVFGPSMVIGGCVGGAVGAVCQELGWIQNPGTFVLVGMCGFFSGAARTPISTIIMVSEMTGSYRLLLPAMWVCGITFLLTQRWTIYLKQVPNRAFSPAHRSALSIPLLQEMRVADVLETERKATCVPFDTPISKVVKIVAESHEDYFPVVTADQRFVGIFSAHNVRQFTYDETLHQLAIAEDIMTPDPIRVTPADDLHTALQLFEKTNLDELPVVSAEDRNTLLTMLRRRAITRAYGQRLEELRLDRESNS